MPLPVGSHPVTFPLTAMLTKVAFAKPSEEYLLGAIQRGRVSSNSMLWPVIRKSQRSLARMCGPGPRVVPNSLSSFSYRLCSNTRKAMRSTPQFTMMVPEMSAKRALEAFLRIQENSHEQTQCRRIALRHHVTKSLRCLHAYFCLVY